MDKKQYMQLLLEQIRSKQARRAISGEIGAHIEEQADAFRREGMDEAEAEKRAVQEMGDPVETGVALDAIHRPQMPWGAILLVGVISVTGLLLLLRLSAGSDYGPTLFAHQICYVAIGFALMLLICFLDYSRLARMSGLLSVLFLAVFLPGAFSEGPICSVGGWLNIGGNAFSKIFVYLAIPLFAVLLYRFRGKQWRGLAVPAVFMLLVLWGVLRGVHSGAVLLSLAFMSAILLTAAVGRGWYGAHRRRFLGVFWAVIVGVPLLRLWMGRYYFLQAYQVYRMQSFLKGVYRRNGLQAAVRQLLAGSRFVGETAARPGELADVADLACDYLLVHVASDYGILALLAILLLLGLLCVWMLRTVLRQKNQLGQIMGLGCAMVFILQVIQYTLMDLAVIPSTSAFLPLLSYGGTGILVTYLLLGLLLSICRSRNLPAAERSGEQAGKFRIRIERVSE